MEFVNCCVGAGGSRAGCAVGVKVWCFCGLVCLLFVRCYCWLVSYFVPVCPPLPRGDQWTEGDGGGKGPCCVLLAGQFLDETADLHWLGLHRTP